MMVKIEYALILLFVSFVPFAVAAQSVAEAYKPARIEGLIKLDGVLDDSLWAATTPLDDFLQALPKPGNEPTERTEIRMLYDDQFLYIGIQAYDSFPDKIVARGMERDIFYGNDDNLGIILDTYNDKRQAIGFYTNALSARFDEEFISNGTNFNAAYNTFWNVKSRINDQGYAVEFQIPFSSLRFEPKEETRMEFRVTRYVRHKNEYMVYPRTDPNTFNLIWNVNTGREIVFRDLKARRPLYLIPFVRATYQKQTDFDATNAQVLTRSAFLQRNQFTSHPGLDKVLSNVGMDIKYGVSKNFTVDATINTDFAQAEADNRVINLTRFSILLPEKRGFFLESADYMSFATAQTQVFNSRTIGLDQSYVVPILAGARITGKTNGYQIGAMNIQTQGLNQTTVVPQNFGLFRIRKELFHNGSFIGAIATNRISTSGRALSNQTVGIDFVRRYGNTWMTGFNAVTSNDAQRAGLFNQSSNLSAFLFKTSNLGYSNTTLVEYSGENFKPRMGFAPDSGYVYGSIYNEYRWQLKKAKRANQFRLSNQSVSKWRENNHILESIMTNIEAGLFFKNGVLLSFAPALQREYVPYNWAFGKSFVIPQKYYSLSGYTFTFNGRQTRIFNYSGVLSHTDYYGGKAWMYSTILSYALSKHFSVRVNGQFNFIRFPSEYSEQSRTKYTTALLSTSLVYTQSTYFSVRLFTQYDNLSKTIGTNLRVRYNPKEGTDLYLVYSPRINTAFPTLAEDETRMVADRQVVIVKFVKALSLW